MSNLCWGHEIDSTSCSQTNLPNSIIKQRRYLSKNKETRKDDIYNCVFLIIATGVGGSCARVCGRFPPRGWHDLDTGEGQWWPFHNICLDTHHHVETLVKFTAGWNACCCFRHDCFCLKDCTTTSCNEISWWNDALECSFRRTTYSCWHDYSCWNDCSFFKWMIILNWLKNWLPSCSWCSTFQFKIKSTFFSSLFNLFFNFRTSTKGRKKTNWSARF